MIKNIILITCWVLLTVFIISCDETKEQKLFNENKEGRYSATYEIVEDVDKRYQELWDDSQEIEKETLKGNDTREGFSYFKGGKCYIVMRPFNTYSLKELETTLGHEHLHCLYGAWHDGKVGR